MINELPGSTTRSEMPILLTMNKHRLQFCFSHAEHYLIKLKLYEN